MLDKIEEYKLKLNLPHNINGAEVIRLMLIDQADNAQKKWVLDHGIDTGLITKPIVKYLDTPLNPKPIRTKSPPKPRTIRKTPKPKPKPKQYGEFAGQTKLKSRSHWRRNGPVVGTKYKTNAEASRIKSERMHAINRDPDMCARKGAALRGKSKRLDQVVRLQNEKWEAAIFEGTVREFLTNVCEHADVNNCIDRDNFYKHLRGTTKHFRGWKLIESPAD